MKKITIMLSILTMFLAFAMSASAFTMATGPTDGYYHNGGFSQFELAVKRIGGKTAPPITKWDPENGTDGTGRNIKLVNDGESDLGLAQLDGALLQSMDNVEIIGIIMYEVAHLIHDKNSPIDECDDLRSGKAYSIGMNKMGGTMITFNSMIKTDPKLSKASIVDFDMPAKAINEMSSGKLNSFMMVSVPGSQSINRMATAPGIQFGECWDSNYKDLKVNGIPLYTKVSLGKKDGYPNSFDTFRVPTVVIANKKFLAENKQIYNVLYDATNMAFGNIKAEKKFRFYPED